LQVDRKFVRVTYVLVMYLCTEINSSIGEDGPLRVNQHAAEK